MNCPWCGSSDGTESHNICDDCMLTFFGVNPVTIHQEIAEEEAGKPEEEQP